VSQENIEALLQKGIDAARAGDRKAARTALERVVEIDPENEKGWFWLASVMDTDEERRLCLRTVLKINPNNAKAKAALDRIEARMQSKPVVGADEVAPGVQRSQLTLILGAAALVVLVVAIFVLFLIISENNRRAADAASTQAAFDNMTATQIQNTAIAQAALDSNNTATAVANGLTQTAFAIVSPTPSPTETPARATLPPTWTPTAPPTATPTRPVLAFPPASGLIVGWGSSDQRADDYLPILIYDLNNQGATFQVGTESGYYPRFAPGGNRVIYPRYSLISSDTTIEEINQDGAARTVIDSRWIDFISLVADPDFPVYAGNNLVFAARGEGNQYAQLYWIAADDSAMRRLTVDRQEYRFPDASPDGSRVVAVRVDRSGAQTSQDLVLINIADMPTFGRMVGTPTFPPPTPTLAEGVVPTPTATPIPAFTRLTSSGTALRETDPRFSHDGRQVYFAAADPANPDNHDLYVIPVSGGEARPVMVDPGDDRYPVPSPDGNWLAFASNRTGVWEIYVLDLNSGMLYQVTNSETPDFPGDWAQ
jgi:Tol biopolymer transport system component